MNVLVFYPLHGSFFFLSQETNLIYVVFFPGPGGSPVLAPKSSAAPSDKGSVPLKVNLLQFRKNVSDLRMQLHQMRQLQARPLCPLNWFKMWWSGQTSTCVHARERIAHPKCQFQKLPVLFCWCRSCNISFLCVCFHPAPEPGGITGSAEAGRTGNQC